MFSRSLSQQKGVALLAALILMMAVILTLSSIFFRHQVDVSRLTKMLHGDQALLLGLSAESWAKQTLAEDDIEVDNLEEPWALAVPLLPVEGGYIRACMVDLQAKLNLNSFADYNSERWSMEMDNNNNNGLIKTWLSLLNRLNLPASEELAVSIIDWIDFGSEPLNQWGAEQNNYAAERSGLMVANALMTDITELAVIRGYNIGVLQQVEPWLTALPVTTAININTADEILLLALGGLYAEDFTTTVLTGRPYTNIDNLRRELESSLSLSTEQTLILWPEELITVTSNFFQLNMQLTLGEAQLEIHSVMQRHDSGSPTVIRRSISHIPNILPANAEALESLQSQEESLQNQNFCHNVDGRS